MKNQTTITALNGTYTASQNSTVLDVRRSLGAAAAFVWTDATASAANFTGGTINVDTITFDTKANTTHGDYVVVYDTAGNSWAVAASKAGIQEVTEMTCVGDVVAVAEVTDITAVADGAVKEITDITCVADVDDSLDKKYFILQDDAGTVGFWFDTDDSGTQVDPALVAATDRQIEITTVATGDSAATVAGKVATAIDADSKFSASATDTVVTVTSSTYGPKTDGSAGNSGFTVEENTAGVDSTLDGTYFILQDTNGSVAFWIDVDNSGTTIPAGASAADRAVEITTISSADSAATIAGLLETAIHADSKFTASSSDTVCTVTNVDTQVLTDAADGDTGFTFETTTQGVTADLLDGTYFILQDVDGSVGFWIDTDNSGTTIPSAIDTGGGSEVDRAIEITTVTSGMTPAQVAGVVATAINADSKFAASAADAVVTITQADYKNLTDAADGTTGFTFSVNTQGTDLGAEPTGAIWSAIPAARKAQADISGSTTAAEVAAVFELAFDGLTGFTTVITSDDTADDGTMTMTAAAVGEVTAAVVKSADDGGAGSISVANTTEGVDSDVDATANTITIADHGFSVGLVGQLTTDGTLPAGLSTGTNYYVIDVDDNTIKLASSLANAQAGTAVDITGIGTGAATHTFTPTGISGTLKLQASIDKVTWFDITNKSSTISGSNSALHELSDVYYNYVRAVLTVTAGDITATVKMSTKD